MSLPSSLAFLAARRCRTTFLKTTAAASTALCISASPNVVLCYKIEEKRKIKIKKTLMFNCITKWVENNPDSNSEENETQQVCSKTHTQMPKTMKIKFAK